MRRIQDDDTKALGLLYDRYARKAYGLAFAVCHRADIAEDVVQEAFISIWRSRSSYRPEGNTVGAWAMTIVRFRAVDAVRRGHHWDYRFDDADILDAFVAPGDVAADAASSDEARRLREALAQLPATQREVVVLAFYGELTHVEIAAHLGLPLSTVKGRMRLALHRLRGST
jgi:RNA polymerase sigma-70 factor (ECF subfamily)